MTQHLSEEELALLRMPARATSADVVHTPTTESECVEPDASLVELHDSLADVLAANLGQLVGRELHVNLKEQRRCTRAEFLLGRPTPTVCAVIRAENVQVEAYVLLQPSILYPMLDFVLGCKQSDPIPQRPISEIEMGVAELLVNEVISSYDESWQSVLNLNLRVHRFEHNLQRIASTVSEDLHYVACYEIQTGNHFGLLDICLPWNATKPLRARLAKITES